MKKGARFPGPQRLRRTTRSDWVHVRVTISGPQMLPRATTNMGDNEGSWGLRQRIGIIFGAGHSLGIAFYSDWPRERARREAAGERVR
jgi:hypothetical protein